MSSKTPLQAALGSIALAASFAASAQSSVTLAGQIGAGVGMKNHQGASNGSLTEVTDNLMAASWLRFSVLEDLGGGMRAHARLETGINADSGAAGTTNAVQGAKFWNRQAWVGLQSGPHMLTLGRQFHAATDRVIRSTDVNNVSGSNLHVTPLAVLGVNRFFGNDNRTDNAVKYRLTVPGVVEFGASIAAGEGSVAGRSYSADIAHTTANYDISALVVHYDAGAKLANGSLPSHDFWGVGGNIKLGDLRPYAAYYRTTTDATVLGRPQQVNKILSLGLAWQFTTQARMTAAYYRDKARSLNGVAGRDGDKSTFVLAGYYALSKRTELYAAVHSNRFTDGYKLEALNIAGLNRNAAEATVSGASLGIKHNF